MIHARKRLLESNDLFQESILVYKVCVRSQDKYESSITSLTHPAKELIAQYEIGDEYISGRDLYFPAFGFQYIKQAEEWIDSVFTAYEREGAEILLCKVKEWAWVKQYLGLIYMKTFEDVERFWKSDVPFSLMSSSKVWDRCHATPTGTIAMFEFQVLSNVTKEIGG